MSKIMPYGKSKMERTAQDVLDAIPAPVSEEIETPQFPEEVTPVEESIAIDETPADVPDVPNELEGEKVEQVQGAISRILGNNSLDNIAYTLTAIGMENLNINAKDGKISVSGEIPIAEENEKITKSEK